MSVVALLLVLAAAVAHAAWNLLSKQSAKVDAVVFLWLVAAVSSAVWAPVAIGYLLATDTGLSWPHLIAIGGSSILHLGYFVLLQTGYRHGDLGVVYPVARGTGPILASAVAVMFFDEQPSPAGVVGILLVGVGVFLLGGGGAHDPKGVVFGLLTGLFICGYTVWDARLVTAYAIAPIVLLPLGEVIRLVTIAPVALARAHLIRPVWRRHWRHAAGAAVLMPLSYLLALFAFTMAPVSVVAPTREVSVLIAVLLGGRLLAEKGLRRRLVAAGIILSGMAAIALG